MVFCTCGKKFGSTSAEPYIQATYDTKGNLIYGVCEHGVVFDNREIYGYSFETSISGIPD